MSDLPVPKNSYVAFDGLSIKEKMRDSLNRSGVFTDQNFEGSNLAAINDAFAMPFSLLMYYLNQTSADGTFSLTNVYENINRVVKDISYNPTGHQTAALSFTMSAENLDSGFYTIPRYSTINVAGINYSTNKDISFTKNLDQTKELIDGIDSDAILYQGTFIEFPQFTPAGIPNEIQYLTVEDTALVDNFNIDVYVKTNGVWSKWTKTQSLFLNNFTDKVYELRFNENKRYEIKFGNDINGKQLTINDTVAIYYLKSKGTIGEVGVGALTSKVATPFNTYNLYQILDDVTETSYMTSSQMAKLSFYNKFPSTYYAEPEGIESIRKNAPAIFRSQFNLTTTKSFETFVRSNFSNIIQDVKVKNNSEFLDSYIKYFYDLGLTTPQFESRALFNQLEFADSCNFNNVYICMVPKTVQSVLSYLTPAQKQIIVDSMQEEKLLTSEIVPMDPVYLAFDICLSETGDITKNDIANTTLQIVKDNSRRSETSIKDDIQSTINSFFAIKNNSLGQTINIQQLTTDILNIDGVKQIYTKNVSTGTMVEGIKFVQWNPVYFDNTKVNTPMVSRLEDFQFPYLANKSFVDRIIIS